KNADGGWNTIVATPASRPEASEAILPSASVVPLAIVAPSRTSSTTTPAAGCPVAVSSTCVEIVAGIAARSYSVSPRMSRLFAHGHVVTMDDDGSELRDGWIHVD